MARAYSEDLRIRLIRLVESGTSARSAARFFDVSASTSVKWVRRWRAEKSVAPSPARGHRRALLAQHSDRLMKFIEDDSELTLEEVRELLKQIGVHVSLWTIWNFFHLRHISLKKRRQRA